MKTIILLMNLLISSWNLPGAINFSVVEKNNEVKFSGADWDLLMKGTRFSSETLGYRKRISVYIEIADQQNGKCNRGIGLGCSIMERNHKTNPEYITTNHHQRMAMAEITKDASGNIILQFISEVNWLSLAMNR